MSGASFLEIVGNDEARTRLLNSPDVYPSLLFSGPQGLGKRLTALWYAAYLNCQSEAAPCGTCPSCRRIASGNHPDLLVQERPEKKTVLGVGEVREGIHQAQYRPYEGRRRVWIIPEAERLTEEAQNSLLKTLEEPPESLVIVLVCQNPGTLLPTVVSRCRPLPFRPVDTERIRALLESKGCPPERALTLAHMSEGRVGWALGFLDEPERWEQREQTLDLFCALPGQDLWGAIETAAVLDAHKGAAEGYHKGHVEALLEVGRSLYRDLLLRANGQGELVMHAHRLKAIDTILEQLSTPKILLAMERFAEAEEQMECNVQTKLLLQRLCMRLANGD